MKLDNAIKLLGKYGAINTTLPDGHDGWCRYHAEVNGVNVSFVDTKGVGVHDYWTIDHPNDDGRSKGRKHASLTAALRHALHRRTARRVDMPGTQYDPDLPPLTMTVEAVVVGVVDGPVVVD